MIVLDTHIWLWWINMEYHYIPDYILSDIENTDQVGVSPVSCFELALAHKKGRLNLPCSPLQWLEYSLDASGISLLPLSPRIADRAVRLTDIHRDPFDRIIIATALELNAHLASIDGKFSAYPELKGYLLDFKDRNLM